ncbi:enoyl-CoA hydratase-related protein [Ottowia thiooxydans]|uniref:enoyl-CoA hydratase-related protein n=1 Tax=Ottowia thiooxydans TaxID=219182 RepID=UPI00041DCD8F|nr:enoyl-CoA hydratase-related protein [Ottowia thiooxydans]
MNYQQLQYEVRDKVAVITFNRPDRLNAWTAVLKGELRNAVMAADSDGAVNCIVLTGAGRAFCAGMDMEVLGSMRGQSADTSDPTERYSYLMAVNKPLIAAINGAVSGVGLCVALYCDIRFMASGTKLSAPYARRGLAAEHGSAWLLPRLIGPMHAADLLLSGRTVLAEEAAYMGLVNLLPAESFREAVQQRASDIANLGSPRSVRIMKRQMLLAQQQSIEAAIELADAEIVACRTTSDFKEGIAHFMEKRAPKFSAQ